MLTHIKLTNFRSFAEAEVALSPVTLVIGANGSGKSNFLSAFAKLPPMEGAPRQLNFIFDEIQKKAWPSAGIFHPHFNEPESDVEVCYTTPVTLLFGRAHPSRSNGSPSYIETSAESVFLLCQLFAPKDSAISQVEDVLSSAEVNADGSGTTQVLHDLKNGVNEARFNELKKKLSDYIPEIENLSFRFPVGGKVEWQVSERGIEEPVPGSLLSEGTRAVVFLLAVLYQERPPNLILLEDIDRGMHPRLFEKLVALFSRVAEDHEIQIIMTTHNPYLVNCFRENPEAVVIVDKKNGNSTLRTLEAAMAGLDYDAEDLEQLPLGDLWFSGYAGGVPTPATQAR